MISAETFLALAARAEAGGDDALSDDVWRALGWKEVRSPVGRVYWRKPINYEIFFGPRPDLRRSIDAQAVLPGRIDCVMRRPGDGIWGADVWQAAPKLSFVGRASTEPLARLAALLRAMAAAQETADAR